MNAKKPDDGVKAERYAVAPDRGDKDAPKWANGLREMYDSVVDEPLPDSFKELLSKLDDDGGKGEKPES